MNLLEIKNLKMDFGKGAGAARAVEAFLSTSALAKPSASSAKAAAAKR